LLVCLRSVRTSPLGIHFLKQATQYIWFADIRPFSLQLDLRAKLFILLLQLRRNGLLDLGIYYI